MCQCAQYESLLEDMSAWIAKETWDGHEKECPAFAGGVGQCSCIKSVREEWWKTRKLRQIEQDSVARELKALAPRMMDLQAENLRLSNSLQWAVWRIQDMLDGDDGQAWQEARKFIEREKELYDFLR